MIKLAVIYIYRHILSFDRKFLVDMPYYAVRIGRNPGVYSTWDECKQQVDSFPKARYKKFMTEREAREFVNATNSSPPGSGISTSADNFNRRNNLGSLLPVTASAIQIHDIPDVNSRDIQALPLSQAKELLATVHRNIGKLTSLSLILQARIDGATAAGANQNEPAVRIPNTSAPSVGITQNNKPASVVGKKATKRKNKGAILLDSVPKRYRSTEAASGSDENIGIVYTDGCCHSNGRNGAKAGIGVYWGPGNPNNVSERLSGRPTNNRAEIHAARKAVEQAKAMGFQHIKLHTDSQFLINGITKWIKGWKRNGWRLTSGEPVINREDFEALDRQLPGIRVEWVHVRGHQGIHGNEQADRLANEGAAKPLDD